MITLVPHQRLAVDTRNSTPPRPCMMPRNQHKRQQHQASAPLDTRYSTLMITFHANAPASLIAQAKHPLLRLLMMAFHPR